MECWLFSAQHFGLLVKVGFSSRAAIMILLQHNKTKLELHKPQLPKFLWYKHVYYRLYSSSPITNENCETIFLCSSLLDSHDVTKHCFLLITWQHPIDCILFSCTVINFHYKRTVVTDAICVLTV